MVESPWAKRWQEDFPCVFSSEHTKENCKYLISLLGESWIEKRSHRQGGTHPLISMWLTRGSGSYVRLNALAEDCKLLDKKPGFEIALGNLRRTPQYHSSLHVLHSAALFERSRPGSVLEIEPSTEDLSHDFTVADGSVEIFVEAKYLQNSAKAQGFGAWSSSCSESAGTILPGRDHLPQVFVVVKDFDFRPSSDALLEQISLAIEASADAFAAIRRRGHNIFVEPAPEVEGHFSKYRSFHFLCPKAKSEDDRVLERVRSASKQLSSSNQMKRTSLLILGLTEMQSPHEVAALISRGFARKKYQNISNVMLLRCGDDCRPPKAGFLDLLSMFSNPNAHRPINGPFHMRPISGCVDLFSNSQDIGGVPAYRYSVTSAKVRKLGGRIDMPNIMRLTPEMLA